MKIWLTVAHLLLPARACQLIVMMISMIDFHNSSDEPFSKIAILSIYSLLCHDQGFLESRPSKRGLVICCNFCFVQVNGPIDEYDKRYTQEEIGQNIGKELSAKVTVNVVSVHLGCC